jgi:hypothetical protein
MRVNWKFRSNEHKYMFEGLLQAHIRIGVLAPSAADVGRAVEQRDILESRVTHVDSRFRGNDDIYDL